MSYGTERRLSPEELKQRNDAAMLQALDTERQVTVTERNWQAVVQLLRSILEAQDTLMTKENLTECLNQTANTNANHLKRMEDTEQAFLRQAGKLKEELSSASDAICSTAKERMQSICRETESSMRELTHDTSRALEELREETRRRLRIHTIISTSWVMLLAGLCTVLHLLNGA